MITETDSLNAYEFKDYFVVFQDFKFSARTNSFKNQIKNLGGKKCSKKFSYNSQNNKRFLSIREIKKILGLK